VCLCELWGNESTLENEWTLHGKELKMPKSDQALSKWDRTGIKIAARYANRLLSERGVSDCEVKIQEVHSYIAKKLYSQSTEKFGGYDWLMATLFIIMQKNVEKTTSFLSKFSKLTSALYVWPSFGRALEMSIRNDDSISHLSATGCHWVEALIEVHHPKIFSAFILNGCSMTQV
jgi:Broad-minded protein